MSDLVDRKEEFMARTVDVPEYEIHDEVRVEPAKSALIVVDMQNDFVKEGGSLVVPDAEATIPAIRNLLDLARQSGIKVVFTQDTHTEGDPEWEVWPEHVREGSWGWQIVDELAPREDELVIRKFRYDAFYGTHLDHFLRVWGVDTLVLCGTVANICVHYTAASAALRWFRVIIPRDATSALDPFDLEASLRQTSFLFAGTITESNNIRIADPDPDVYRSKVEEAAAEVSREG
ncbi:MAG: cysteine hydrolase [Actinomycetota bacterium]|nr:cysteine hydrolase [Actinomycetota bacterium]